MCYLKKTTLPVLQGDPEGFRVCDPLLDHPLITSIADPSDVKKGAMWACRYKLFYQQQTKKQTKKAHTTDK